MNERGASLLLGTLFMAVLMGMAALIVGLGFLFSSKSKMQNIANMISLGVIEKVTSEPGNINGAIDLAKDILQQNKLPGAKHDLAGFMGPGGVLTFGTEYFQADPVTGVDYCAGDYPCFIESHNPASWTAVKVTVQNEQQLNPITAPFASLFGLKEQYFQAEATAYVNGTCVIQMQDTSLGSFHETHQTKNPDSDMRAKFAFPASFADPATCPYSGPDPVRTTFCKMDMIRPAGFAGTRNKRFQSDYAKVDSGLGEVLVDRFRSDASNVQGPEPLRSLMEIGNAVNRYLYQDSSGLFVGGMGFAQEPSDMIPSSGLSRNTAPLIRATNFENMEQVDEFGSTFNSDSLPNFLSTQFFDVDLNSIDNKANYSKAFSTSIKLFENQCPRNFKRVLMLYTSVGIGNCVKTGPNVNDYDCEDSYDFFRQATDQLLLTAPQSLSRRGIKLLVINIGDDAHTLKAMAPAGHVADSDNKDYGNVSFFPDGSGSQYMGIDDMIAKGFTGARLPGEQGILYSLVANSAVVDSDYSAWCNSTVCPEGCFADVCRGRYAYENYYKDNVSFNEGVSALYRIATETGGSVCPIRPLYPDADAYLDLDGDDNTPKILDDSVRAAFALDKYAPWDLSRTFDDAQNKALQAVRCANRLIRSAATYGLVRK